MRRRGFLGIIPVLAAAQTPAAKVQRWDVITVGNLSRNRYWGEANDKAYREVLCTCTLIRGEGFRLLVDPSVADPGGMAKELNRRTGLALDDITAVFVTHEHGDHWPGITHFPKVPWYASEGVAEVLNKNPKFTKKVEPAPQTLFGAVEVVPTPGHTRGHHSLRFDCGGQSIVIAGDAVATLDFWRERRSFFNAVDPELGAKTMDHLASIATIIVPGHDNYFLSK
jgi:glyoxylase-like metal-dependent hydrolase (beta-lactamase superfamily II)